MILVVLTLYLLYIYIFGTGFTVFHLTEQYEDDLPFLCLSPSNNIPHTENTKYTPEKYDNTFWYAVRVKESDVLEKTILYLLNFHNRAERDFRVRL